MDLTTEFSSDFTFADYHSIRPVLNEVDGTTPEWKRVLDALHQRVSERFLDPIRELERFDTQEILPMRPGFAIMALDCLLIDMIQSFKEGRASTVEISPAASFRSFLRNSEAFKTFSSQDRSDFFNDVRNGILHNGETRHNWKIRIEQTDVLTREPGTGARIIDRARFHAGVVQEYDAFRKTMPKGPADVRQHFLRRMDALCDWPTTAYKNFYFAYGSNMLQSEIERTVQHAEPFMQAYLAGYRLSFDKHAKSRNGDAANIVPASDSMVWGFVYRISDEGRRELSKREGGYHDLSGIKACVVDSDRRIVATQDVFTFIADERCTEQCGPSEEYRKLVVDGALSRELPEDYIRSLSALRPLS